MSLTISLAEADLREMPTGLRDQLLKWYFDRSPALAAKQEAPNPMSADSATRRREDSGRVTFQEFCRAGLLRPGTELLCKSLKRQQRNGGAKFVEAGRVSSDGSVTFRGRRYDIPSKLAVEAVNSNGGHTEALNGYDYLFVRSPNGDTPLSKLRDAYIRKAT